MPETVQPTKSPEEPRIPAKRHRNSLQAPIDFVGRYRGVLAFVLVFILGVIFSPDNAKTGQSTFLNWSTQSGILFEYAEYGIIAAGMTLVILTGGIDLSVGSVLGFGATLFSLLVIGKGWSIPLAVATTLAATALMGAISGSIISRFKIQPFVATLGMMLIARGAAKWISGGEKVQPGMQPWYAYKNSLPEVFNWLTSKTAVLGLRPITLLFLLSILVLWILVRFTRFGRHIYAIGGNVEAARLSGIKVGAVITASYLIAGLMAGLAGICNASRMTLGDPDAGATYELDAIAAVVIGGTSLMGGKGSMFFTLLGTLIIAYISKILSLNSVPEAPRLMVRGGLIVIAVMIQQTRKE